MHIILDSNVYLSDIRMAGISFHSLFALIRRTQSTLVLPHLVREEVIARYEERLDSAAEFAKKAWKAYGGLMLYDPPGEFEEPNLKRQRSELRRRLRKPAKGIEILNLTEVEGVDIKEVYLRGIRREAPANKNGEELRDVILWLSTVAYAKETGDRLAFVSGDSGFYEGDEPHPKILQDIRSHKVNIELFKKIGDLITKEAPTKVSLTEGEVMNLCDREDLRVSILSAAIAVMKDQFGGYRGPSFDETNTQLVAIRFLDAASYPINPQVSFGEIDFGIDLVYSKDYDSSPQPAPSDLKESFGSMLSLALARNVEQRSVPPAPGNKVYTYRLHFAGQAKVFARIKT
jgi:hypothetical protein